MKPLPVRGLVLFATVYGCLLAFAAQSQSRQEAVFLERKTDLERLGSRAAYDSLHFLLTEHYTDLSAETRKTLRKTLKKYAVWSFESLCPDSEAGIKITLSGQVQDVQGHPVAGAQLHIFQTNHQGYYSPSDASTGRMLEQDPRLDGFLTTDSSGTFRIYTIRPASYPKKYEGRLIPGHIHVVIDAAGFREKAVQVVFAEDPAMTEHWLGWAKKQDYPVVELAHSGPRALGTVNFQLHHL